VVDPAMISLCVILICLVIVALLNEWRCEMDRPVEASSASGNLAELVVLRQVNK